jgi:molybdenum cofactor cytidylyltransferase
MDQATIRDAAGLWIILLAAGSSSRLGYPKQLLRLRGRSLLTGAVEIAHDVAGHRVVVVVGAAAQRLRSHLRRNCTNVQIVLNNRWRDGLGSSLAAGVHALPSSARRALVLLCDQPNIDARCLRRLLARRRGRHTTILASHYGGRLGVPAVFPRSVFRDLRKLDGDIGARALLNDGHGFRIAAVPMPEAGRDIDTPADAAALRHQR